MKPEPARVVIREIEWKRLLPETSEHVTRAPVLGILFRRKQGDRDLFERAGIIIQIMQPQKQWPLLLVTQMRNEASAEDARLAQPAAPVQHKERMAADP